MFYLTVASEARLHHITFPDEVAVFSDPELPFPLSHSLASYVWNFYRRMSIVLFTAPGTQHLNITISTMK